MELTVTYGDECVVWFCYLKLKPCKNLWKPVRQVYANWNLTETKKRFLHCWNCTETYCIRFQLTDSPFCFRTAETGLKLTHQVSADGKLTESSGKYTFFPHSCNSTGNFISKFPYKFGSVLVSLKRYFSSSVYVLYVLMINNQIIIWFL